MADVKITNAKLGTLSPYVQWSIKGDFELKDAAEKMFEPLLTPAVPNTPVGITVAKNQISVNELMGEFVNASVSDDAHDSQDTMDSFLGQTMAHYIKGVSPVHDVFLNQAATTAGIPIASSIMKYTVKTDIIPACTDFMQQTTGQADDNTLQASFGYTFRMPGALGLYFVNDIAFSDFMAQVKQQYDAIKQTLPVMQDTTDKFNDITSMNMKDRLVEVIRIRNGIADANEEYSFARCFVSLAMAFIKNNGISGIIPFDSVSVLCPEYLVFVNVSQHAVVSANAISNAWREACGFKDMPYTMVSTGKLPKMSVVQNVKTAASAAAAMYQQISMDKSVESRSIFNFSKEEPDASVMIKRVFDILHKMKSAKETENAYRKPGYSFSRPSRRDPNNYNLMGKTMKTAYYPNIHIYLDTSGSITESNYESMIKGCIEMALKLNCNMFFSSFSTVLSSTVKLHTKGRSKTDIYREFERIPKVTGGTNYEQVWNYILDSNVRQEEFSMIITDFGWTAPSGVREHPKNLYYCPCLNMSWDLIQESGREFEESMQYIAPDISRRIIL